jgi:hypothetical protein
MQEKGIWQLSWLRNIQWHLQSAAEKQLIRSDRQRVSIHPKSEAMSGIFVTV